MRMMMVEGTSTSLIYNSLNDNNNLPNIHKNVNQWQKRRHSPAFVQIAPMLGVTDKHFRQFIRGITNCTELWTEMNVDATLLHTNDLNNCLDFHRNEHPIVCQLGGWDSDSVGRAAELIAQWGYDEININAGCPSVKIAGRGRFGAVLMKHPERLQQIMMSIHRHAPNIATSVKTRIGVDELDSIEFLRHFIQTVALSGCKRYIIHARKAWLNGINPSKNRRIPPLEYHKVYQIAKEFPDLSISINGGITSTQEIHDLLRNQWKPLTNHQNSKFSYIQSDDNGDQGDLSSSLLEEERHFRIPCLNPSLDLIVPKKNLTTQKQSEDNNNNNNIQQQRQQYSENNLNRTTSDHYKDEGNIITLDNNQTEDQDDDDDEGLCFLNQIITAFDDNQPDNRKKKTRLKLRYSRDREREAERAILSQQKKQQVYDYSLLHQLGHDPILEGVMIGRAAFHNPCMLSSIDSEFYKVPDPISSQSPRTILENYLKYLDDLYPLVYSQKEIYPMIKPILGILCGLPGTRIWRHQLDEYVRRLYNTESPANIIRLVVNKIDSEYPNTFDTPTRAKVNLNEL